MKMMALALFAVATPSCSSRPTECKLMLAEMDRFIEDGAQLARNHFMNGEEIIERGQAQRDEVAKQMSRLDIETQRKLCLHMIDVVREQRAGAGLGQ